MNSDLTLHHLVASPKAVNRFHKKAIAEAQYWLDSIMDLNTNVTTAVSTIYRYLYNNVSNVVLSI